MPDSPPPDSVLYRFWAYADPPRLEFLSAGADAILEATPAEVCDRLVSVALPLVGVDEAAFYAGMEASVVQFAPWAAEFGYRGPASGRVRWFQAADFPQVASDGTRYFLGTLLDVTARREAEAAERAAADRLAAHMANTPLAVVEWDAEFRVARWSGAAEVLFGWSAGEVVGRTPVDFPFVHPADADRVAGVIRRLRTGAERRNVVFNRNLHKSGRELACEWHNSVLFDGAGRVRSVLSLALDRTPAATAQAAVAKGETRLKAALFHARMLGWEHDLHTRQVTYSGDRAAFYGAQDQDDPSTGVVHPADRVRVAAALAAAEAGTPLAVEFRGLTRTPDGRPRWFLARGHVEADPDGTPARIVGVTAEITDRVHAMEDRAALDRALIEARRAPAAVAHRLNNALAGVLGRLAEAERALADHPAADPVRAAVAALYELAEASRRPAPSSPAGPRCGQALVADDEPNMRELMATVLEEAGYTVTKAADGAAAEAAFAARPDDFRLVVADLLMPGLEGDALVARLRLVRPGLPAVLTTGFATRPIDPAVLDTPHTRLLPKPFRLEHLLAAVRAVTEADAGRRG